MSVLSDQDIRLKRNTIFGVKANKILGIDPLEDWQIQPASVDLRLGTEIRILFSSMHSSHQGIIVDPMENNDDVMALAHVTNNEPFLLMPGQFILASTHEKITVPDDLVGRLEGKSSLGRLGLLVHSTAGYVDPGWSGDLTLELTNVSTFPIRLRYLMPICQISFITLSSPAERVYGSPELGSKYQGGGGAVASRPMKINN